MTFQRELMDNPRAERVQFYSSLQGKKQRDKSGLALVEGINTAEQLLAHRADLTKELMVDEELLSDPRVQALTELFGQFRTASREVLDKISPDAKGVLAVAKIPDAAGDSELDAAPESNGPVILLKDAQDPGNAGAIVRAAAALGASKIILAGNCVEQWNPKVIRASAGTIFQIPVQKCSDFEQAVGSLRAAKFNIAAADIYCAPGTPAVAISQWKPAAKQAVVFGNEARGLSESDIKLCDESVFVPLSPGVESLNLAGTAHIFLFVLRSAG